MIQTLRQKIYRLLRWSERYTKADMVYIARGGFWVTFGQVMSNLLSLALIVAFANLLPKETYGLYRYILSIAGVLNIFTLTGMNNAVSRAVAAGDESSFRTSISYQFKWNLMMLAAFFVLGGYYAFHGDSMFAFAFFILGTFIPATLVLNTYGAYLDGKREFRIASITSALSTLVYVIGVLAAILFSGDILWLIAAYAITTFCSTFFFYTYTLRRFKPAVPTGNDNALRYGRELTFIGFIAPIAAQIDKIVLAHFWGAADLAVYSLARAVPDKATLLIKNLVGIGFPKFSAKTPEEINRVFYRRVFQGMAIGATASVLYIIVSPFLFIYILPQYLDAIVYSQILALSFIFAMPNRYISLLLVSQKLSQRILTNNVILSVLNITLYVVLGISGGILGLVIAYVLNSFIGMLINIAVWRKKHV